MAGMEWTALKEAGHASRSWLRARDIILAGELEPRPERDLKMPGGNPLKVIWLNLNPCGASPFGPIRFDYSWQRLIGLFTDAYFYQLPPPSRAVTRTYNYLMTDVRLEAEPVDTSRAEEPLHQDRDTGRWSVATGNNGSPQLVNVAVTVPLPMTHVKAISEGGHKQGYSLEAGFRVLAAAANAGEDVLIPRVDTLFARGIAGHAWARLTTERHWPVRRPSSKLRAEALMVLQTISDRGSNGIRDEVSRAGGDPLADAMVWLLCRKCPGLRAGFKWASQN
ncbi:MAG: hypothetical protein BWY79_02212 [Actinobacteria bacterium ADurb.Bin444]|nr:MAG: hypothetical protein BWY79_02212 [Actinobacteria bacterium ADurb.Bin444]